MTHSTFAERFAYARTLRLIATGDYPSKAEIGRAVRRTGQAVGPWETLAEPPTDWRVHAPLAAYLGVDERWLVRDEGEPPRPELWAAWIKERRGGSEQQAAEQDDDLPTYIKVARRVGGEVYQGSPTHPLLEEQREAKRKRAAGEGRPIPRKRKR